ncbi:hypothetical protein Patl1_14549 [Pistacia atlantica]|uniref:Uncharacterized protein n=1 Tax=Pistacia atlantica TaxID=434234 RepID=A0ACC1ASM9_9ROSI|nr:hypothetical protein Patl1_14549 [Pistacia atlantica]
MCLARGRDGKNPVHIAVIKGCVSVLKELVKLRPNAARTLMERGETILHACVRFDLLEAMKFLMEQMSDHEFVNSKDDDGNTILYLAVADKQAEVCNRIEKSVEKKDDWLKEMNNALMVVASLIATVTFQAVLNPLGGVWQDTKQVQDGTPTSEPDHIAGVSIMAYIALFYSSKWFNLFFTFNTMGFVASLCIILLLMSGLPFCECRLFTWILMVILWVAISALTLAYLFSLCSIVGPKQLLIGKIYAIEMVLFVWMGVMGILLLSHTIHFIKKIITKARRDTNGSNGDKQRHNI